MKTETVVCDACGQDLSSTGRSDHYRFVLDVEKIPRTYWLNGDVHEAVERPLKHTHHFCDGYCLRDWAS
jgi:tRNA(Ile2) C34 agmatinyltransferase TiaS